MLNQRKPCMKYIFHSAVSLACAAMATLCIAFPAMAMMTPVISEPAIAQEDYPQPTPPEATAATTDEPTFKPHGNKRERVVLLHGIGRTSASMGKVARAFRHAGYKDYNLGYRSTRDVLAKIVSDSYNRIRHFSDRDDELVHFVCYSLGCLVTRGLIEQHRPKNLGRVVMLGPPNQGSEMADYLKDHTISNWIFGPNLPQLGTANRHNLERLIGDDADYELGIIAGNSSIDPLGSTILPAADDGRVTVESTKLHGMKEHLVMNANHTTLIMNDAVIAQALYFIQNGQFNHDTTH